ncbi:hypothetical protein WMY93_025222 [Mugilogobius chulae]|uniref:Uncharacterized protein n=1 Tax=Mugilogobius chulae TaxID=88201 RepID=A0AAW0NCU3_9GOBI
MEKNTVTRTFSIGAINNRAKAFPSEDFFAARRHSSAGIRALLWANNSKLFGCSLGSDSQTSLENTFPNILTPDSIPQFTIPSLSVTSSLRSLDATRGDEEESEGYGSSEQDLPVSSAACSSLPSSGLSLSERKAERSVSDPLNQRRFLLQRDTFLTSAHTEDPASRAALSLPHLAKITTPYGFITLSQSPQMASEEALLCQSGLRHCKDEEKTCSYSKAPLRRTGDVTTYPSHLSAFKQRVSKDSAASKERLPKGDIQTLCTSSASCFVTAAHTDSKFKSRFREIIKKHFTIRNR